MYVYAAQRCIPHTNNHAIVYANIHRGSNHINEDNGSVLALYMLNTSNPI